VLFRSDNYRVKILLAPDACTITRNPVFCPLLGKDLLSQLKWPLMITLAALMGAVVGYVITLIYRPTALPPVMRLSALSPSLSQPMTILLLGTDVVYTDMGARANKKIDQTAFNGRSDTIMVARFDPARNAYGVISIPRDTKVSLPGQRFAQKINSANAIGGPLYAAQAVAQLLDLPIDHYVVLNVHGLVELVNELGGVTVDIPKKMEYMDWTAKLKIDLEPGYHTLTGNQAMGFVRFRHDALGDIGRVQRQQLFLQAVIEKAKQPSSWTHIPQLLAIAERYISTDLSMTQMMGIADFARTVPKANQFLCMLPGNFGEGDWVVHNREKRALIARLQGLNTVSVDKHDIRVCVQNGTNTPGLAMHLSEILKAKGYVVSVRSTSDQHLAPAQRTKIIAEKGNTEDADAIRTDLGNRGEVISASIGDLESAVTVVAGEDVSDLISASITP
jgi:LCP family protein required for cell wall assembly